MGDDGSSSRIYRAGSRIFREGEPGEHAYIIESGRVRITALADGDEVELALLGNGDLFGEVALVDDQLRTATATAVADTQVLVIERHHFDSRMDAADPMINVFLRVILERFRATQAARLKGVSEFPQKRRRRVSDFSLDRQRTLSDLHLQSELEEAIEQGDLRLHYQPIMDLERLVPVGFEALVRWQHASRGLIPPSEFVPLAERTGLIVPMGLWMVREAPLVLRRFQALYPSESLHISVNVSARQLMSAGAASSWCSAPRRRAIRPRRARRCSASAMWGYD